jgi:hypothetical protein
VAKGTVTKPFDDDALTLGRARASERLCGGAAILLRGRHGRSPLSTSRVAGIGKKWEELERKKEEGRSMLRPCAGRRRPPLSPAIAGRGRRPPWPTPLWISPVGKEVGTGAEEKGWEMIEEEEMADGFEADGARPHRRR